MSVTIISVGNGGFNVASDIIKVGIPNINLLLLIQIRNNWRKMQSMLAKVFFLRNSVAER